MFDRIGVFRHAMGLARHAGAAQAASAQNLAHADTPGYRALRMPSFADALTAGPDTTLRATRDRHLFGRSDAASQPRFIQTTAAAEPSGNGVSLEEEMMHANTAKRRHGQALAVYRHGLTVLRAALGS